MIDRAPMIFGAFVVVLVGVIMVPSFLDLASTDTDEHGRVPVPGERVLELPEGRVGAYYGERRKMPSRPRGDTLVPDPLPVPKLRVRAVPVGGGAPAVLRTAFVDGGQFGGASRTTRQFGVLEVPAAGAYRVGVRSASPIRYPQPRLSLGGDSSEPARFGPSEWLLDHLVLVIVLAFGVLVAVMVGPAFRSGRGGGPPPPPSPPGDGDRAGGRLHLRV